MASTAIIHENILYTTPFDGNWLSEYIYGSSDSLCIKTFYRHEFFPNVKTTLINASKQIPLPTRDHVCAHKKWFLINLVEAFSILQNANLEFCIQWMNWLLLIRKLNFWMNEQCLRYNIFYSGEKMLIVQICLELWAWNCLSLFLEMLF